MIKITDLNKIKLINVGKDELSNDVFNIEINGKYYIAEGDYIITREELERMLSWCQCKGSGQIKCFAYNNTTCQMEHIGFGPCSQCKGLNL